MRPPDFGKEIVRRATEARAAQKPPGVDPASSEDGLKYAGAACKSRMDLICPAMLEELGYNLLYGAVKYSENNWRRGIPFSGLIAAAHRHLNAFQQGVDRDPESGIHHLIGAIFSCMAVYSLQEVHQRKDLDDRILAP